MLADRPDKILLDIQEKDVPRRENQRWEIAIRLIGCDGFSLEKDQFLYEPTRPKHNQLSEYLNKTLDIGVEEDHSNIERELDKYPENIFKGLALGGYSDYLNGKHIDIRIFGRQTSDSSDAKSIHSLHWELLENISYWNIDKDTDVRPASVTVQRCSKTFKVQKPQCNIVRIDRVGELESFNILLIVARTNVHEATTDYYNPSTVLCAILKAEEELESRRSKKRIHLEVVRPGSCDELKAHLQQSSRTFQIVHFDVHGDVNPEAHLILNRYADTGHRLDEHKISASDIAQVLLDNGIHCAVLGSCKTAVTNAGVEDNFSLNLLEAGMASLLAFSYNVPDTMSQILFPCFYYEILVNHREFADAAAIARRALFENPRRWSYVRGRSTEIKDWFIPQVYSNGKPWCIGARPDGVFIPLTSIIPITLVLILFMVHLAIAPLVRALTGTINSMMWIQCFFIAQILLAFTAASLGKKWPSDQQMELIKRDRKNILRVEGDLRRKHRILLHAANDEKNTVYPLLDALSYVWCRTHLVQHRVMIKAEWFLQPLYGDSHSWTALPTSLNRMLQLWLREFSSGLPQLSRRYSNDAKVVIVVANVGVLFPGEDQERKYHLHAQRRFRDWLERYLGVGSKTEIEMQRLGSDGRILPPRMPYYLVLIGTGLGASVEHWSQHNLGGVQALDPNEMIVTHYTNPASFVHKLPSFDRAGNLVKHTLI